MGDVRLNCQPLFVYPGNSHLLNSMWSVRWFMWGTMRRAHRRLVQLKINPATEPDATPARSDKGRLVKKLLSIPTNEATANTQSKVLVLRPCSEINPV